MLSFDYKVPEILADVFGSTKKVKARFYKKDGNYIRVTGYGIFGKGVMVHPGLGSINIMPCITHLSPDSGNIAVSKAKYYRAAIRTIFKAIAVLIDQRGYQVEEDKN